MAGTRGRTAANAVFTAANQDGGTAENGMVKPDASISGGMTANRAGTAGKRPPVSAGDAEKATSYAGLRRVGIRGGTVTS